MAGTLNLTLSVEKKGQPHGLDSFFKTNPTNGPSFGEVLESLELTSHTNNTTKDITLTRDAHTKPLEKPAAARPTEYVSKPKNQTLPAPANVETKKSTPLKAEDFDAHTKNAEPQEDIKLLDVSQPKEETPGKSDELSRVVENPVINTSNNTNKASELSGEQTKKETDDLLNISSKNNNQTPYVERPQVMPLSPKAQITPQGINFANAQNTSTQSKIEAPLNTYLSAWGEDTTLNMGVINARIEVSTPTVNQLPISAPIQVFNHENTENSTTVADKNGMEYTPDESSSSAPLEATTLPHVENLAPPSQPASYNQMASAALVSTNKTASNLTLEGDSETTADSQLSLQPTDVKGAGADTKKSLAATSKPNTPVKADRELVQNMVDRIRDLVKEQRKDIKVTVQHEQYGAVTMNLRFSGAGNKKVEAVFLSDHDDLLSLLRNHSEDIEGVFREANVVCHQQHVRRV